MTLVRQAFPSSRINYFMFAICKKELRQFFSSLTGYLAIIIFLLLSSLFLFVFPDTNLFDYGYATLDSFFELAPWVLPTFIYVLTIKNLSTGGVDSGGITGSYIGLIFLSAAFTAIGICCSSFTNNAVVAFLSSAFACFILYNGFGAISGIPSLQGSWDYVIEMIGIDFHYRSLSRGAVDSRDMIYFLSIIILFLFITRKKLMSR